MWLQEGMSAKGEQQHPKTGDGAERREMRYLWNSQKGTADEPLGTRGIDPPSAASHA